jgi:uncharacterized protein YjiS (DUF1127 family)
MIISILLAKMRRQHREAKAIRQLSELDDRTLADLGIIRSQIPAAVAGLPREHMSGEERPRLTLYASRAGGVL